MRGCLTLFAEGRLPETFGGWSRVRRLRARENVSRALGRLWGTARRALGPGCEELADGWVIPPRSAAWSRIDAAVERREAGALYQSAQHAGIDLRQRIGRGVNIRLVRRSALLLPSFAEGQGTAGVPGALQTNTGDPAWLFDI